MIVRHLYARQSRSFLALGRQGRFFNRLYSTETPVVEPEVQSRVEDHSAQLESSLPSISDEARNAAQEAFVRRKEQETKFRELGSKVSNAYQPEDLIRFPPKPSDITLELLLASQTHLGHSTSRWNPQNSRYIFGIRDGIHIISLDVTAAHLRRAARVVEEVAARGGLILFVGTRPGQKRYVINAAELSKAYHVFERWTPGSLTNGQQILGHCATKVVNAFDEELPAYQEALEEQSALKPDLVVCLNPVENDVLLHECGVNNIPTIGVIDTDADPTRVTYPIPSNDDSLRAVGLIAGVLGRAGQAGQARRLEAAKKGTFTYSATTIKLSEDAQLSESQPENKQ
ncbi:hypothetical protein P170DRAFT_438573 [Aspergillus steynii IBT 23096]|uniref:Ribosomal protein S2 n=1 Tax=Aspergillus steynii IBT 23096 TaxID=1392250 RepID=A0A2I2G1W9_9EURO|nr:uncharacterized protein P170DRAFT_438573 [Aspergillus steynii IBT 23096]PLB46866.1 hypothetical protein P170DRAFT_438573 [Aspergillus steynii IBT 23096]